MQLLERLSVWVRLISISREEPWHYNVINFPNSRQIREEMGNGPGKKDLRPPRHSLGVRTKKLTGAFSGLHNWAQVSCVIPTLVPKSPLLATGYTILPPRGSSSAIMSVGTYSLSGSFTYPTSTLFKASEDIPVTNEGPTMTFVSSDLSPIWSGSTVFSSGYM